MRSGVIISCRTKAGGVILRQAKAASTAVTTETLLRAVLQSECTI